MKTYIEKIKTKNFKGLGNFEYKPRSKGINMIYGENGSGKSSLVNVFNFLTVVMEGITIRNSLNRQRVNLPFPSQVFNQFLDNTYESFVTKGSDQEEIEVEIQIKLGDEKYSYKICMDFSNAVTYERLALLKKADDEIKKVLLLKSQHDNEYHVEKELLIESHTNKSEILFETPSSFVSILSFNENIYDSTSRESKNERTLISKLIHSFSLVSISNSEIAQADYFRRPVTLLPFTKVKRSDKAVIDRFRDEVEIFEEFVTSIDEKIISVSMVEEKSQNMIGINQVGVFDLSIEFEVRVSGKIRKIALEDMSAGTQDYLKYFRMVLIYKDIAGDKIRGTVTVFDEFGIHLHPTLAVNILNYLNKISDENGSQLIATTHQTILLNKDYSRLNNKQKQILSRDRKGYSIVRTLENTGNRDNLEKKYLRGDFGGNKFINVN